NRRPARQRFRTRCTAPMPSSSAGSFPCRTRHPPLWIDSAPMPEPPRIIVLEGDQTGQELLDQARRLLEPDVCRVDLEFEHYDLSLANRRRTGNEVVVAAARAMREAGYGLKAATITPEGPDDVGSPN